MGWLPVGLVGLGALLVAIARDEDRLQRASLFWPHAPGIIVDVPPDWAAGELGSYYVSVQYRFEVNGESYLGSNLDYSQRTSNLTAEEYGLRMRPYYPGAHVNVYYNPENPRENVLEPGPVNDEPVKTLLVAYGLVGVGLAWTLVRLLSFLRALT